MSVQPGNQRVRWSHNSWRELVVVAASLHIDQSASIWPINKSTVNDHIPNTAPEAAHQIVSFEITLDVEVVAKHQVRLLSPIAEWELDFSAQLIVQNKLARPVLQQVELNTVPIAVVDFVLGEQSLEAVINGGGAGLLSAVGAENWLQVAVLDGDTKVGACRVSWKEEAVLASYFLLELEGEATHLWVVPFVEGGRAELGPECDWLGVGVDLADELGSEFDVALVGEARVFWVLELVECLTYAIVNVNDLRGKREEELDYEILVEFLFLNEKTFLSQKFCDKSKFQHD